MNLDVLMASGQMDSWGDVSDALDDRGSLVVVSRIDGSEIPGDIKTLSVSREVGSFIPQDGKIHEPIPEVKTEVFRVMAVYAPGMWIKVEFA